MEKRQYEYGMATRRRKSPARKKKNTKARTSELRRPRSWAFMAGVAAALVTVAIIGNVVNVPEKTPDQGTSATAPDATQSSPEMVRRDRSSRPPVPDTAPVPPVVETTPPAPLARPTWQRHAVAFKPSGNKALVAIVIDDMGLDRRRSAQAVSLPAPLTLAYLPYGRDLPEQTSKARAAGHELLVHLPMQPEGAGYNPGPNVIKLGLSREELKRRLEWNLSQFNGYVGVNNHMGSRFTASREGMAFVMREIKARELLFLDSRTSSNSVGAQTARSFSVPAAERHVFLDHVNTLSSVRGQLTALEKAARRNGFAVAIGHPRDATLAALREWLPTLEGKGLQAVPLTTVIKRSQKLAQR